ncbi:MAG TPA: hypothetical protein VGO60_15415 [Iamia sp.]|jgi:hypothetical protein|nr:hypothetical protein [Iamia sp.]
MAFTVRIEGADADALQRQADAEHRPVEEVAREVISHHVARRGSSDLAADIDAVRADQGFTTRVADLVERDQEILDRLAE